MEIKNITSPQNSVFKDAVKKQQPRQARLSQVFTAEGVRAVDEVLKSSGTSAGRDTSGWTTFHWEVESVWIQESFAAANQGYLKELSALEAPVYQVPDAMFRRLSDTEHPQGVLAIVRRRQAKPEEVFKQKENLLLVVLENLQDPGNVGTILRTADAAGATAILCTKGTCDVYSPKVVRSSMGSLLHVPVLNVASVSDIAPLLEKRKIRLLAAHLKGEKAPWNADMKGNVAIMIGNEGAGLSEEASQMAHELVKIPMPGSAESLNAGIACGMLLYEALRQRS